MTDDEILRHVHRAIRTRHYSRNTEAAYTLWIRRYLRYTRSRDPKTARSDEVSAFLTSLAVDHKVAASTQNQALAAILFLFRDALGMELPWLTDVVRAKQPQRLPVVLTRDELRAVLGRMSGLPGLMARLLYGSGLRLLECCASASKISTSADPRLSFEKGRETVTVARCSPPDFTSSSRNKWSASANSTGAT